MAYITSQRAWRVASRALQMHWILFGLTQSAGQQFERQPSENIGVGVNWVA